MRQVYLFIFLLVVNINSVLAEEIKNPSDKVPPLTLNTHKSSMSFESEGQKHIFTFVLPQNWQQGAHAEDERSFVTEFHPQGQSYEEWQELITFRIDKIIPPSKDINFFKEIIPQRNAMIASHCNGFTESPIEQYTQNGRPSLEYYIECLKKDKSVDDRGEAMLYKVIPVVDELGIITVWKSWKLSNETDLNKARLEKAEFNNLFRQMDLESSSMIKIQESQPAVK